MKFSFHLLKNTESTGKNRVWGLTQSFVIAIISVTFKSITSRPPIAPPTVMKNGFGRDIGESSDSTAQTNNPWVNSRFKKTQAKEKPNEISTDLDSNYRLASALGSRTIVPYFWQSDAFKWKFHSLPPLAHDGRRISEMSIPETVQEMKKDHSLLRYHLESFSEALNFVNVPRYNQNAYQLIDFQLKQIKELLCSFFDVKLQRDFGRHSLIHNLTPEMKWNVLLQHTKNIFLELETLLLYPKISNTTSKSYISYLLIAQIFRMFNFFIKYKLIQEDFFKNWFQKENILNIINSHVTDAYSEENIFDVVIQEAISKSRAMNHLSNFLKFFKAKDWKLIASSCFRKKRDYLVRHWNRKIESKLRQIDSKFMQVMFAQEEKVEISKKREEVVRALIEYFLVTPCEDFEQQYHTYGLLHEMFYFVMQYHTELFESFFQDNRVAKRVSERLLALDSAMKWLRSSREVEFMASDGFWTNELDYKNSSYLISLKKAQTFIWETNLEQNFLEPHFDHFLSKFFNEGCMKFKSISCYKKKFFRTKKEFKNVNSLPSFVTYWFGTNFDLRPSKTEYFPDTKETNDGKFISALLLGDLYRWLENLNSLLLKFRRNEKSMIDILKNICSSNKDDESRKEWKHWIEKSTMYHTIDSEIRKTLEFSEQGWDSIHDKMVLLSQHLKASIQKPFSEHSEDLQGIRQGISEINESFNDSSLNFLSFESSHSYSLSLDMDLGIQIPHLYFMIGKKLT